jgi:hypothetical protein
MQSGWRPGDDWRFAVGDHVRTVKGSSWQGGGLGFYRTEAHPIVYSVESERERVLFRLTPKPRWSAFPVAD